MARQKELEEKIAKSKMELAAASAASKAGTPANAPVPAPQVKPAMDLGEKQAMEDRLRKLVLQSRKPAQVQPQPSTTPAAEFSQLSISQPPVATSADVAAPAAEKPSAPAPQSSSVSVSTHSFSLEDMAVSFITQTIETMKSQPASVPEPHPPASLGPRAGSQADVRSELAAKQKRLEEHISETKLLMAQLPQAKTKEEKERIMRTMREKTRCVRLFWLCL